VTRCRWGGECVETLNPNRKGTCCRCGRRIRRLPALPPPRDPIAERVIAESIAGPEVRPLQRFAQQRAAPGPVSLHRTRDFFLERMEEMADDLNYGVWGIQQLDLRDADDATRGEIFAAHAYAITKTTEAYNALARAREVYMEFLERPR
jgi:hypothetical protein